MLGHEGDELRIPTDQMPGYLVCDGDDNEQPQQNSSQRWDIYAQLHLSLLGVGGMGRRDRTGGTRRFKVKKAFQIGCQGSSTISLKGLDFRRMGKFNYSFSRTLCLCGVVWCFLCFNERITAMALQRRRSALPRPFHKHASRHSLSHCCRAFECGRQLICYGRVTGHPKILYAPIEPDTFQLRLPTMLEVSNSRSKRNCFRIKGLFRPVQARGSTI